MFSDVFDTFSWDDISQKIYATKTEDVAEVLAKENQHHLDDFLTLLSPAAAPFLETMVQKSYEKTIKRFGKTIQLFLPMYVSNECQNICTYCGFSYNNAIKRITLNKQELLSEARAIQKMGFKHLLLVSGEANKTVGLSYFQKAISTLSPFFPHISLEVQPLDEESYKSLYSLGLNAVLVYQETYRKSTYKKYHPKGKKSNFTYRINTPDRIGKASLHKIGLGVLLGLEDWRVDSFFTGVHLKYLEKKYWKSKYSISFPRLRPSYGCQTGNVQKMIADKELIQLICAYRLFNEELELSLSTRENKRLRDNLIYCGITSMSAGSKTSPGAYSFKEKQLEQFEIDDTRDPKEISTMLRENGYEPVWKDWDFSFR